MITCPKCNKELEDGTKFCEQCGAEIYEMIYCNNCGEKTSTEFQFCQNCGASLAVEEVTPAEEEAVAPKTKIQAVKEAIVTRLPFDVKSKKVKLWSAVVAAALVVVMILSMVLSYFGRNNFVLYLKDGELMYTGLSNIKPFEVTEDSTTSYGASYTMLSKDGKKIFYLDEVTETGGKLYYREVNKPKKDAEKIDSDVMQFMINEKGNRVTYYKDGKIYQHNLKDKDKLASNVKSGNWSASKDGKNIIWMDTDGKAYFLKVGKDKEKIDSNITRIIKATEDCKTVWYMKDDNLYVKESKKDKEKIASNVDSVVCIYDSGELYFRKKETDTISLKDYVIDDKKDSDAQMIEPEYPSLSDFLDIYETYDEAYDAYDKARDEYYDARDEWWEKEDRDGLREDLENETIEVEQYDLYYYNGKKVKTIAKNIDRYSMDYAADQAVLAYSVFEKEEVEKVKLSEIDYMYQLRDKVESALEIVGDTYVAIKDKTSKLSLNDIETLNISTDGKMIYAVCDMDEETSEGDLYKIAVSGKKLKKAEKIASDAYAYGIVFVEDNKLAYFKDVDGETGDLYVEKAEVDSDVAVYSVQYSEDLKGILYKTEVDEKNDTYTLKQYKGKKDIEIADDVYSYSVTPNGKIVYLTDYDTDKNEGDLYLYKKSKPQQIDDEVSRIITIRSWDD